MQYIRPGSQYLVPSLLCISSLSLLRNLCLLRKFPNWKGKFSRKSGLHTTASEDYQGRDHEGQSRCSTPAQPKPLTVCGKVLLCDRCEGDD